MECSSTVKSDMRKAIGIVGGVGPYAGLDLNQKIFSCTPTKREQDHFQVYLLSCSSLIGDRTEFLLDPEAHENPGVAIAEVVEKLYRIGAEVVGIPCNTSHCAPIYDLVLERMHERGISVTLVNMIEETARYTVGSVPEIRKVGLLATRGTYASGVYSQAFAAEGGIEVLTPDPAGQELVHSSIYDPEYGIKNHPNPISRKAVEILTDAARALVARGAEAVIMGCTEIPLAMRPVDLGVPRIDSTLILARALIAKAEA
jgi:aspartate racemase